MVADVDANLLHNFHGFLVYLFCRFRSGGADFNALIKRLQKTMGHLTAATVAGA
jgi:hypothetical protein